MKIFLITLVCSVCMLLCQAQQNQTIWIKGQIHSIDERKPMAGVTVKVIPGKDIAATDIKGNFSIHVKSLKDSLQFSMLGYATQTVVAAYFQKQDRILLEKKTNYLAEAMVNTGYQSLSTKDITGAVDVVSNQQLNQQTGLNIVDRLNNITSAIRFDNQGIENSSVQKLNFSVRGLSTINANRDPLIVLDGFIYEGNIQNIDPNNVESISVLKDAAASSIWGARAGNGVIVITSKKGTFNTSQRTKLSFSNTYITKNKPDLMQQYQLSNKDFIDIEQMLFNKGYYNVWLNYLPHLSMTPVINLLNNRKKGLISPQDSMKTMDWLLAQDGRKNYMDEFYNTPFSNQLSLNINGGSEFNSYALGMGYTTDRTHLDANNKKLNIQLSNSFRPIDRLQIDLNILFTNQRDYSGKPDYSRFKYSGKSVPYMAFRDASGQEVPFDYEFNKAYLDKTFSSSYLDWGYYPLSDYKNATNEINRNEWFATTNIRYQLFPFLSANASFQWQNQQSEGVDLFTQESYNARLLINKFSVIDPVNGTVKYHVPLGSIRILNTQTAGSYTARAQLDFNKATAQHVLTGIFGAEIRENTVAGFSNTAYGYNKIPLTSIPVDHANTYMGFAPTFFQGMIPGAPYFTKETNRFVSLYSNWSEIYQGKYSISGSFRQDGGNIFGANTNDRWSPLWSVGASWQLDKEDFFQVKGIDYIKLRTTYGYSGNVDLRKTPYPIANSTVDPYSNYPILAIRSLNDPSLRWEKTSTLNFGVDFSILQNRISGSIDHYIKKGKDLYGMADYDYTAWGVDGTITKNVASMEGRGWDFTINSRNTTGVVSWNTRLLFSMNKNRTTSYFAAPFTGVLSYLANGNMIQPVVGKPLHGLAAYKWMGLNDQGMPQGLLNGEASTDYMAINQMAIDNPQGNESIRFIGSSKPQLFGNLINSVAYKGIELAANVSYKGDYYFNKPVTYYYSLFYAGDAYPDFEKRWQKPGDEAKTNVPGMVYPYNGDRDIFYSRSEINALKADHLRLEYVSLAWQQKKQLGYRTVNVRLFANASNLGIIWRANKEHIDPEFPYRIRPAKTYSLGVQIDY